MRVLLRVIVLVMPLLAAVSLAAQSLDVELQRAVQREVASGDVRRAIAEYRRIADRAGSNRAVAAQALLRLAEAHQKLGDAEANKVYEQIVEKFNDQIDIARTARARLTSGRTSPTAGMALRRVWTGPEVERSAPVGRVSPDGRHLAFPANSSHQLIVREVVTGAERVLVQLKDAIFWQPLWYPDGKRLAFVVEHERDDLELPFEIRVINLDGSGMRVVLRNRTDMGLQDWSKDGSRILAMMDDPAGRTEPGDCRGCTDGFRLFWVDAGNGTTTTLASGKWNGRFEARLSPDGRYVAFGAIQGLRGREIGLVAADGSGETRLSTNPQDYYPVTWSPDGRHVVVTSMRGPVFALWTLPVANGKPDAEPAMISRELCTGCTVINPWGSTRSGAFYFSAPTFASEIRTASLDPQSGTAISPPVALSASRSGFNVLPKWSPDGRRILYQWGTANTTQRVLTIASLDNGTEQRLDWLQDFPGGYCWSGNDAVLFRRNTSERKQVYRASLTTRQETFVFEEPTAALNSLMCVGDGRVMAYVPVGTYAPTVTIRNLDTDSVSVRELPAQTRPVVHLSPDGKRIAFLAFPPPGTDLALYVAPVDGGTPRELVRATTSQQMQNPNGLAWSADSRHVYFSRRDRASRSWDYEVFRIAADGGREERVGLSGRDLRDLSVSPDGRRIAFSVGALNRPEVWAIENFLPAAK